jgi:hypothetical protein
MQMFTYFGKPNENIQNAYKLARNMTGLSLWNLQMGSRESILILNSGKDPI